MTTQQHKQHVAASAAGGGLNERFTALADAVSTFLGDWKFTIASLLILLVWIVYGAVALGSGWFTSQGWNFPLNTLTTVGEWFIGALVAAAANRVERHNRAQVHRLDTLEQQNLRMEREHGRQLAVLATEQATLRTLTEEQTVILREQSEILALLRDNAPSWKPAHLPAPGQPPGQPAPAQGSPQASQATQASQAPPVPALAAASPSGKVMLPTARGPVVRRDRAIKKQR